MNNYIRIQRKNKSNNAFALSAGFDIISTETTGKTKSGTGKKTGESRKKEILISRLRRFSQISGEKKIGRPEGQRNIRNYRRGHGSP
jgi:hypothetical protein